MIRFKQVTAGFEEKIIFENLNLELPDQGCFALMGPSGSGKTTMLRLIMGTILPQSGQIEVTPERKMAFLFQEDRLLGWETALSNVALSSTEEKAKAWLQKMEIQDVLQYPGEMSGGMRRRVAIARALSFEGEILLMDEPFKGLDEALKDRIAAVIRHSSPLIIMTTHDEKEAARLGAEILHIDEWIAKTE